MEIRQALVRYCRGVDRGDRELIKSAFHPDAADEHGPFRGLGWELADRLTAAEADLGAVGGHHISNVYIELDDPDHARVESYVTAYHPHRDAERGVRLGIFAGRYLDLFERRGGEWRIALRRTVNDWSRVDVPGEIWDRGSWQRGGFAAGQRGTADPSYEIFPPLGRSVAGNNLDPGC